MFKRLKNWAEKLKKESYALYFACRDPRVSWYAKLFTALVAAYALSPVDLIPDFIPVLGYLDDLIIIPLGLFLARRLIPDEVMADARKKAEEKISEEKIVSKTGLVIVISVWVLCLLLVSVVVYRYGFN